MGPLRHSRRSPGGSWRSGARAVGFCLIAILHLDSGAAPPSTVGRSGPGRTARSVYPPRAPDPFRGLSPRQQQWVTLSIIQRTFQNTYGTDQELLAATAASLAELNDAAVPADRYHVVVAGLPLEEQQRLALHRLCAMKRSTSSTLALAAVHKLAEMGDRSSLVALQGPLFQRQASLIKSAVIATERIGERTSAPPRGPLKLRRYRTPERKIEEVLRRGEVVEVRPLSTDVKHAFSAYVVTFRQRVNGQPVKAIFKPTGPDNKDNWLQEEAYDGPEGGYAFVSREVFSYSLDKLLGVGRVPPTVTATLDLPGWGTRTGSLQYFIPHSKSLGSSWQDLRPEFEALTKTESFVRQMDTLRVLSYIEGSIEHVPTPGVSRGNWGNILVDSGKGQRGPYLWKIDNANSGRDKYMIQDVILPLRFERSLLQRLAKLQKDRFIRFATPYIGPREAEWTWQRIQRVLEVAKTRDRWSTLLRIDTPPGRRLLAAAA